MHERSRLNVHWRILFHAEKEKFKLSAVED